MFGEYGKFPHGLDETSLSHYTLTTDLGDWKLISTTASNPNPTGGNKYGIDEPTIIKIEDDYYIFNDLVSLKNPYKIIEWKSKPLDQPFDRRDAITPRSNEVDDWDNYRIQDGGHRLHTRTQ